MRRKDREIPDFNDIVDVLQHCDTIRLGLHDETYPYVVPLSFGIQVENNALVLYVHGAKNGKKHTLLARCNRVCVEADLLHRYAQKDGKFLAVYESIIGYGEAVLVTGEHARTGLSLLLEHCNFAGLAVPDAALASLAIYKITLHSVTGKRCSG